MKIGYIYLYGEEWEEWKKHNKPLPEIIDELKTEGCEKIYMDIFIENYGFKEIERVDMKTLVDMFCKSKDDDQLVIKGRVKNEKSTEELVEKEINRIKKIHHRQI